MKIWLITPPMTQLNTPYPAVAYLAGFLKKEGFKDYQTYDFSIELALKIFSKSCLSSFIESVQKNKTTRLFVLENKEVILDRIESVVQFLQGKNPTLAFRIAARNYLPEGPRFQAVFANGEENLEWGFGTLGIQDKAKYLASIFLTEITDFVKNNIDSKFELARYGEKLAASQPSFDALYNELNKKQNSLIDNLIDSLVDEKLKGEVPDFVVMTAPFPGNAYGAFRIAKRIKQNYPNTKIALGGGWVNTELRSLKESRVFQYFDFVCLDDGERPLLQILKSTDPSTFVRTFVCHNGNVEFKNNTNFHDIPQSSVGVPDYSLLPLDKYVSFLEMLNPMHRMWSDLRWNKLTVAHGCYWKKCTFCDLSLDYISRYENTPTDVLVEKIQDIIKQTGSTGFHFVDEAAPPAALKSLAEKLIEKNIQITWWANIRFEKSFDADLCKLLAKSGCIAVTGGLEVASNRLLKLMQKGVSVEQVARVTKNFSDAGVMVHAYLMYGFPTQTHQETLESLERVRQLFEWGCIQSAFWHRFSVTAHSPIGMNPEKYFLKLDIPKNPKFAFNDVAFVDTKGEDPGVMTQGLNKALYNYMHGIGLDRDVREWFPSQRFKKLTIDSDFVSNALLEIDA